MSAGELTLFIVLLLMVAMAAVLGFIVFMERAQAPHPHSAMPSAWWGGGCTAGRARICRCA